MAILLKALNAVVESLVGVLLWFVKPETMSRWIQVLTQAELAEDPEGLIAGILHRAGQRYASDTHEFGAVYLVAHGLVKLVLILLLWSKKLWAYPLAGGILVVFVCYQVIAWATTHTAFLLVLSVFDAILVWLIAIEYRRLKRERSHTADRVARGR